MASASRTRAEWSSVPISPQMVTPSPSAAQAPPPPREDGPPLLAGRDGPRLLAPPVAQGGLGDQRSGEVAARPAAPERLDRVTQLSFRRGGLQRQPRPPHPAPGPR